MCAPRAWPRNWVAKAPTGCPSVCAWRWPRPEPAGPGWAGPGGSHAIHGAIGFTQECDLHLFPRRLHAWRQTAGSESFWHAVAGAALVDQHQGLTLDLLRATTDV